MFKVVGWVFFGGIVYGGSYLVLLGGERGNYDGCCLEEGCLVVDVFGVNDGGYGVDCGV